MTKSLVMTKKISVVEACIGKAVADFCLNEISAQLLQ